MHIDESKKDVYKDLMDEIGVAVLTPGAVSLRAFTSVICEFLTEKSKFIGELNLCSYNKIYKSARARVDAYNLDLQTHDLTLLVSDFSTDTEISNIGLSEIKEIFKQARRFYNLAQSAEFRLSGECPIEVLPLANLIYDNCHLIKRVRYILATNRQLGNRVKDAEFTDLKNSSSVESEYTVWDFTRYYDTITSINPPSEIEVNCCSHTEGGRGLPFLTMSVVGLKTDGDVPKQSSREYTAYLLMVPGKCVYDWYATYADRLLEQNVRTFLQFKGKVNRGIRTTIMEEPNRFLAYNNGLTATADEVTFDKSGQYITGIKNLQIVNGGQTTASIYSAFNSNASNIDAIVVQMKLIVVPRSNLDDMVSKISRFANSQNKIKDTDLSSNQRFMLRIENFSRSVTANPIGTLHGVRWFFERTRGQYANSINVLPSEAEKNRFKAKYPKENVFTKPDLAKFILTWDWKPWIVARGGEKAFMEFSDSRHLFGSNDDNLPGVEAVPSWKFSDSDSNPQFSEFYYIEMIGKAMLYRSLDRALRRTEWCKGYKSQIVTYTLASFHKIVFGKKLYVDFIQLWKDQRVPPILIEYLVSLANTVNNIMLSTAKGRNVGEWAKREDFWIELRKNIWQEPVPDDVLALCVSAQTIKTRREASISAQKKRNGDELRSVLITAEDSLFMDLKNWLQTQRVPVSRAQMDALNTRIIRPAQLMGADAFTLMKLWQQSYKAGFLFAPPEE